MWRDSAFGLEFLECDLSFDCFDVFSVSGLLGLTSDFSGFFWMLFLSWDRVRMEDLTGSFSFDLDFGLLPLFV